MVTLTKISNLHHKLKSFTQILFAVSLLQGQLYVSSFSELVEVPVANCTNYQSCGECILSRDPYCAWNGRHCVDIRQNLNKYAPV